MRAGSFFRAAGLARRCSCRWANITLEAENEKFGASLDGDSTGDEPFLVGFTIDADGLEVHPKQHRRAERACAGMIEASDVVGNGLNLDAVIPFHAWNRPGEIRTRRKRRWSGRRAEARRRRLRRSRR